mmetsp:Transcript_55061/g.98206  ORF Transcript_55061/g.98206 Transcript_55061/m.98206 type:complete len:274 (+) Transcript_55061:120-941(+)
MQKHRAACMKVQVCRRSDQDLRSRCSRCRSKLVCPLACNINPGSASLQHHCSTHGIKTTSSAGVLKRRHPRAPLHGGRSRRSRSVMRCHTDSNCCCSSKSSNSRACSSASTSISRFNCITRSPRLDDLEELQGLRRGLSTESRLLLSTRRSCREQVRHAQSLRRSCHPGPFSTPQSHECQALLVQCQCRQLLPSWRQLLRSCRQLLLSWRQLISCLQLLPSCLQLFEFRIPSMFRLDGRAKSIDQLLLSFHQDGAPALPCAQLGRRDKIARQG